MKTALLGHFNFKWFMCHLLFIVRFSFKESSLYENFNWLVGGLVCSKQKTPIAKTLWKKRTLRHFTIYRWLLCSLQKNKDTF